MRATTIQAADVRPGDYIIERIGGGRVRSREVLRVRTPGVLELQGGGVWRGAAVEVVEEAEGEE